MDNRKRRSNRIDRWLREISESERHAPPIDFSEIRCMSQHTCCMADQCPLLKNQTDSAFLLRNPGGHASIALQVASHDTLGRMAKPVASDSLPTTGSSSNSESLEFTSTESNTELKQSSASSLASSLDSNKMKVVRHELQQKLQSQHQQQGQQQQQQQHHQNQQRSRQSCHGASGDNRVEVSSIVSPAAPAIRSASPPHPLPMPPQLPQVHTLQLPTPLPPPPLQPPLQLQLPLQQHQPLQPVFVANARESLPPPSHLPPLPMPPPPTPPRPAYYSFSPNSPVAPDEFQSGAGGPSSAAAGVTYYFHLSRHQTSNSGQEQQLLALMRTLHDTDPALTQISATRGVSISLGRSVETSAPDLASLRRKVVIHGSNWHSVMEAVNDLSRSFPDLMSSSQSTAAAAVVAAAASASRQGATSVSGSSDHQGEQQNVRQPTPPQPPQPHQQQSRVVMRPASPPKQFYRTAEQQLPSFQSSGLRLPMQYPAQNSQQFQQQPHQPPAQPLQFLQGLPLHQQNSAQPSASTCYVAASTVSSAGYQQGNLSLQQLQSRPLPLRQEYPRPATKPKLAQNVRFQLTTQQRESLFTQDEAGRPTHPRLKHLLTMLCMDLVFLERSVTHDKVPSVKVRFFFESFDQLTSFCKAIDYQIPSQT